VVKFRGMHHIALKVHDVERSAELCERAFSMRRFGAAKRSGDVVQLVSPDFSDQITLSSATLSGETGRSPGQPGEHGGINHLGFNISPRTPLDEVRKRLVGCGATFLCRADIHPKVPSLFFKDPDGYVFQVTRFPLWVRLYVMLLALIAWFKGRAA
jgi:catechol 2,3-dioxygenase-like lactoylglutathione lyase family enzyme